MATYTADQAQQNWPALNGDEVGDVMAVRGKYNLATPQVRYPLTISSTPVALALNDVVELCKIPAGHAVVDVIVDIDKLDTGTAIVFSVGVTGTPAAFIATSTGAQTTGGSIVRMNAPGGPRFVPANTDTVVILTVTTGPTTGTTSGIIGITVLVRPQQALD